MNEDVNQVFNDSAMPSPDLEMLNTLRGTGIQVELREVRMVMIVFKWCLALEGDHGRPYWRWHLWLRTPGRKISILSSTQQSILLEKNHQLCIIIIIGGTGWTSCCCKPQASGQRYSHDCWCELADLSIKLYNGCCRYRVHIWTASLLENQLQAAAFLSKPHIVNVLRSGHQSWMFITEAVSRIQMKYHGFNHCDFSFFQRCFMEASPGLLAWQQWRL